MKYPTYEHNEQPKQKRNSFSFVETFEYYKNRWIWFLLSVIICCVGAVAFFSFIPPQYEIQASVLIKSNDGTTDLSEFSAFTDLSIVPKNTNIENESELLKSRKLTAQVVRSLQLNCVFYDPQNRFKNDLFPYAPLKLTSAQKEEAFDRKAGSFEIECIDNETILWKDSQKRFTGKRKLGNAFETSIGTITLLPTASYSSKWYHKTIGLEVKQFDDVVDAYQKAIDVKLVNDESSVLVISMKHSSPIKAEAAIDQLIEVHNQDALSDKNSVAKGTAQFINDRIDYITKELSTVEVEVEQFKTENHLTDVMSDAGMYAELGSENEKKLIEQSTQLELARFMLDAVKSSTKNDDLIPTNVGITDQTINDLTLSFNNLVLERNKIVKNSSEKNPVAINLDEQLSSIKKSLTQSINNLTTMLSFEVRTLRNQDAKLSNKLGALPHFERTFRDLQRQQQVKESLYLYLLQKREETAIALAVNDSNLKVIDKAHCNGVVVSPNKKMFIAGGIFVGLFLPFVFFYLRLQMDTKIHNKHDLEFLQMPFIGEIPWNSSGEQLAVQPNSNSEIAESFRLLRFNLSFILNNKNPDAKVMFVSSTISNEGKSFTAINLAASYALLQKKVLLVGLDLRAPKLLEYTKLPLDKGVTNYIVDHSLSWKNMVLNVPGMDNIDLLPSGPIPPNPAELLTNPRVKQLFDEARKEYDYIIVDTAPLGLVSDTLLIADIADVFVYIVRANHMDKRMLEIPERIVNDNQLKATALVLNGVDLEKGKGYGYGYGYGYGVTKKKTWKSRIGL